MKKLLYNSAIIVVLSAGLTLPYGSRAADATVNLKRAQITGLQDSVITVAYTERGRKVYDPLLITPETTIFIKGKSVTERSLRLRQNLWVTAIRIGDELLAQRIDIGGPAPVPKKPAAKPTVKSATVPPKK